MVSAQAKGEIRAVIVGLEEEPLCLWPAAGSVENSRLLFALGDPGEQETGHYEKNRKFAAEAIIQRYDDSEP